RAESGEPRAVQKPAAQPKNGTSSPSPPGGGRGQGEGGLVVLHGARHGYRHTGRSPGGYLRTVRASRSLHRAPIRWHGARLANGVPAGKAHGRRGEGAKCPGAGEHIFLYRMVQTGVRRRSPLSSWQRGRGKGGTANGLPPYPAGRR